MIFAKERFLAALTRWRSGQENFAQLPDGPAKQLIATAAEQKRLPGSHSHQRAVQAADDRITPEYFDEARKRLGHILQSTREPKPEQRKLGRRSHTTPPESFAATPEGQVFREWGRALEAGETLLSWADYKARHLAGVSTSAKNPGATPTASC